MSKLINRKTKHLTVVKLSRKVSNKLYYFECLCECGNTCIKRSDVLNPNSKASCGCRTHEYLATKRGKLASNRVKDNESSKRGLFNSYKRGANDRNYEFSIEFNDFITLTSENCYYCNKSPSKPYPSRSCKGTENPLKYYYYNGLDRVDPKIGYTIDNVKPCCENCNYAKSDLTESEFLEMIENIYKNRILKI